ncbi:MAG: hypothetical protein M1822_006781 [Bathelium mastoideum]|nr:MAG: hypothetical protein M1822_006781 [Bathelium mastoideum]
MEEFLSISEFLGTVELPGINDFSAIVKLLAIIDFPRTIELPVIVDFLGIIKFSSTIELPVIVDFPGIVKFSSIAEFAAVIEFPVIVEFCSIVVTFFDIVRISGVIKFHRKSHWCFTKQSKFFDICHSAQHPNRIIDSLLQSLGIDWKRFFHYWITVYDVIFDIFYFHTHYCIS